MNGFMGNYRRPATGNVYPAGMNYLTDLIVRPGIEKTFGPVLLYMGGRGRGWAHRLWNASLMMMACEAETLADAMKIFDNPAYSQICGPVRRPSKLTLHQYLTRLADNPAVTKQIPQFTDYIRSLEVGDCRLQRVDRFSDDPDCAEWRVYRGEEAKLQWKKERGWTPKREQLFYPFAVHDTGNPDDGFALVKLVNAAVPSWLSEQMRGDVCQDIIVGVLAGDIEPANVFDHVERKIRDEYRLTESHFAGGKPSSSRNAAIPKSDKGVSTYDEIM